MTHSRYLRNMARLLRVERQLSVDKLAARLALPRSTVYYWVRDLPVRGDRGEAARDPEAREDADEAPGEMEAIRPGQASAYEQGLSSFDDLAGQPTFRDFVSLYVLEGYKRDRKRVAVANGDPAVMRLANRWIWRLTDCSPSLSLTCKPDQDTGELRRFWGETIGATAGAIHARGPREAEPLHPWAPAPVHGVLTIAVEDRLLRARLQAWMCRLREGWR
jgi:transposase-like protein